MKKSKKSILSGILVLALLLTVAGTAMAARGAVVNKDLYYGDVSVTLNGANVPLVNANGQVVEPFVVDGTTYLPVRAVSEAAGLFVDWDETMSEVQLSTRPLVPKPDHPVAEQRIVCLAPSMVECVYGLGMGQYIVGWSAYTDYPQEVMYTKGWEDYKRYEAMLDFGAELDVAHELTKDVAVVSRFMDCNYEVIDALEPTLILAEADLQKDMADTLAAKGYKVLHFTPKTLEDVYQMMLDIGAAMDVKDVAEKLVSSYRERVEKIEAVTSTLDRTDVYFEIRHRDSYVDDGGETVYYGPATNGSGTPFDDMITIAGGKNLYEDLEGDYIDVSFEETVKRDPDVILSPMWPGAKSYEVTTLYEIMTRPGFDTTAAVQNSRVMYYDSSLFKRFGPRTITAIEKLAYLLHPYYFQDPDTGITPWELGRVDQFEAIPSTFR